MTYPVIIGLWAIALTLIPALYFLWKVARALESIVLAISSPVGIKVLQIDESIFQDSKTREVAKLADRIDELESDFLSRFRKYWAKVTRLGHGDTTGKEKEIDPDDLTDVSDLELFKLPVNGETEKDAVHQVELWSGQPLKQGQSIQIVPYGK